MTIGKDEMPEAWIRKVDGGGYCVVENYGRSSTGMASDWSGAAGPNATEDEQLEAALRMLGRILRG